MSRGALEGIKVVDLSRVIAGPYCTMMLGDFGADIIKVEKKGEGDMSRLFAPFYEGESTYFMTHNRNKKSITLDFRNPKSHKILLDLIKNADVLVENFKAGTLEKMGLDPKELLELNPRLIITRLSGFGQDGPYANRFCYDAVAQSLSGLMSITGEPDGQPTMIGTYVCDMVSGLYGVIGTLAALNSRNNTGKGQIIDVGLLDAACSLTHSAIINYFLLGQVMQRNGNQDRAAWPATFYPTKNGRLVVIHAGLDQNFKKICKIVGKPEVAEMDEYKTLEGRSKHIEECDLLITEWSKTQDIDDILKICEDYGIPCARVNDIEEMVHDEQLIHRKMIREVEHPDFGKIKVNGPVIKMSDTKPDIFMLAPKLGQHNKDIYGDLLGYSEQEIAQMEEEGLI